MIHSCILKKQNGKAKFFLNKSPLPKHINKNSLLLKSTAIMITDLDIAIKNGWLSTFYSDDCIKLGMCGIGVVVACDKDNHKKIENGDFIFYHISYGSGYADKVIIDIANCFKIPLKNLDCSELIGRMYYTMLSMAILSNFNDDLLSSVVFFGADSGLAQVLIQLMKKFYNPNIAAFIKNQETEKVINPYCDKILNNEEVFEYKNDNLSSKTAIFDFSGNHCKELIPMVSKRGYYVPLENAIYKMKSMPLSIGLHNSCHFISPKITDYITSIESLEYYNKLAWDIITKQKLDLIVNRYHLNQAPSALRDMELVNTSGIAVVDYN